MGDAKTSVKLAIKHRAFDRKRLAAEAIMKDCCDRRGIKNQFYDCDEEVLEGIIETWKEIITICLEGDLSEFQIKRGLENEQK